MGRSPSRDDVDRVALRSGAMVGTQVACEGEAVRAAAGDVRALLEELCVRLGFCLEAEDRERIAAAAWVRAEDLADAVFRAEGMSEPYDLHLWRQVRNTARARLSWGSA